MPEALKGQQCWSIHSSQMLDQWFKMFPFAYSPKLFKLLLLCAISDYFKLQLKPASL